VVFCQIVLDVPVASVSISSTVASTTGAAISAASSWR
jgi:hypothetical protein